MTDKPTACCRWWSAPRADAPRSVDVNHVCNEPLGHHGDCHCVCGAWFHGTGLIEEPADGQ